ncbi:hypothetical protein JCM33374_g2621 [Metschnikowia sp. JCM 33374]|nr:hypothetical protein JCM33374_g2621 [Metschnikowia sp. JCM 33374]
MPSTKSATPVPAGHATESLRIGTAEEITALAKLNPVVPPNDALVTSLKETHSDDPRWRSFRNDPNYLYVLNWLFQCRGYIRLASEHFDCDLFEIELFQLVNPPPVDDMALLVNKVKLALISKIHGKKVSSLAMFETLFRVYFGSNTPLSGPSEEESDTNQIPDSSVYPSFDDLFIDEKIQILSLLISEVSSYPEFREYIDKAKLSPENLRLISVLKIPARDLFRGEDYLSLFDGTALYKRTVNASELIIPKKRKLAPQQPELHYSEEAFDISSIEYELVYKDIYGLNSFVKDLSKNKKLATNKAILDIVSSHNYVSNVFSYEIRKRKILSSRKKEFEMARLLATRKRSSRIEAKEKQRHLEEEERKAQELEDLRYATTRRSQRAHNQNQQKLRMDYTAGLSREERLNLRKDKTEDSGTPTNPDTMNSTPVEDGDIISIVSSPINVEDDSFEANIPVNRSSGEDDGNLVQRTSKTEETPESFDVKIVSDAPETAKNDALVDQHESDDLKSLN